MLHGLQDRPRTTVLQLKGAQAVTAHGIGQEKSWRFLASDGWWFPKSWGFPHSWMVFMEKSCKIGWIVWGVYPNFRKSPHHFMNLGVASQLRRIYWDLGPKTIPGMPFRCCVSQWSSMFNDVCAHAWVAHTSKNQETSQSCHCSNFSWLFAGWATSHLGLLCWRQTAPSDFTQQSVEVCHGVPTRFFALSCSVASLDNDSCDETALTAGISQLLSN